jgi:hypothetical protein
VAFDAKVSVALMAKDLKSGGHSFAPMNRLQFKNSALGAGLKGQALKRAHKAYCNKAGLEIGGEAGKAFTTGALIPVSFKTNSDEDTVYIKAVTPARFDATHKAKAATKPELTQDDAFAMIAKAQGISVDDLKAALTLAAAK